MSTAARTSDDHAAFATAGIALALYAAYATLAFVPVVWGEPPEAMIATRWFGLDRFALVSSVERAVLLALPVLTFVVSYLRPESPRRWASRWHALIASRRGRYAFAALCTATFWALGSRYTNLDGQLLQGKIPLDVARMGTHVTHDELWELHLHSRAWVHLHRAFGVDVAGTYRILSAIGGGVFVAMLLGHVRSLDPRGAVLVPAALLASGFSQLFFGDVENYTLTNVWLLGFLLSGLRLLEGRSRLVVPAAWLGTAMTFHLVAALLGPSSLVLAWAQRRRPREIVAAVGVGVGIVLATLAYFDALGLPVARLFTNSHAFAQGGHWERYRSSLDGAYLRSLGQWLLLVCPCALLGPVAFARRGASPARAAFLGLGALAGVLFALGWRAQLGVFGDWNLFAFAAQPIALAVGGALARRPPHRLGDASLAAFFTATAAHALAGVLVNHRY